MTEKKRRPKPQWVRDIAKNRITKLLQMAEETAKQKPARAARYVELALRISKKYNIPIPARWKKCFCKKCFSYYVLGENLKIRKLRKRIAYICLKCSSRKIYGCWAHVNKGEDLKIKNR